MSESTTFFLVLIGVIIIASGLRGWYIIVDNIYENVQHHISIWLYLGMLSIVGLILTGIYYILLWAYHSIMETYSYVCNWL